MTWRSFFFLSALLAIGWPTFLFANGVASSNGNRFDKTSDRSAKADDRPNIVVILVDDMGFSDLGCYGGEIDTPHIDRLASNGLRYTQSYNCGRCCPTRASLLTGLYPHETGMGFMAGQDAGRPGYRGDLNRQCITVAEALRQAGYATYMAGKWHICADFQPGGSKDNWPRQRGFDRFFGTLLGVGSYWDPLSLTEGNTPIKPQGDFYYTEATTDKVVEYLRGNPAGKPFFCYVSYTAPHFPLHAREEVIEKYRGRFSQGWDKIREERRKRLVDEGIIRPEWKLSARDDRVPAWEDVDNKEWRQSRMEAYAATLDHVDQGVGKIVKTLKDLGQLDNTLLLFLSDNGGEAMEHFDGMIESTGQPWVVVRYVPMFTRQGEPVVAGDIPGIKPGPETTYAGCGAAWANASNSPFRRFKTMVHEGGISTPLIVHWPKSIHEKGTLRHQPVHVIDFMPTFLELAKADYPKTYENQALRPPAGVSIAPTFENRELHDRPLFWEHYGNRAVRDGKWKLVAVQDGPWELYDLDADRTETRDVSKQHPEIVARLSVLYDNWARRTEVLPWEEVKIPWIAPESNPQIRSTSEIEAYLDQLESRGIEAPFVKTWRETHPRPTK
ncbi:MAG TPA: arylsulfatase [Planctomycetaceae bacterium]|nr:arylsulfatase [Planctomycetaceae bacterium]